MEEKNVVDTITAVASPDQKKWFNVTITETLQKVVHIEAADQCEAEEIVQDNWANAEYILDADHFIGAEFNAVPSD